MVDSNDVQVRRILNGKMRWARELVESYGLKTPLKPNVESVDALVIQKMMNDIDFDLPTNPDKHRAFYAIFPDGRVELHENVRRFARLHGLHASNIITALKGKLTHTGGIQFMPFE